ncbi:MAG TPA: hypothetical protein VFQ53_26165 [Kofleriaceae bacterium]|nr:hypothetical protein [Kofleriaceae bacterium]
MIATAPGKLILTGEYAVLDGAPALVVAVDRRVVARRRAGPRGSSPFLVAVADELARRFGADDPAARCALEIAVDSSAFYDRAGAKIGIGSSAAVTVAGVALALSERGPVLDRDEVMAIALAAHAAAQSARGSAGSGADIAASVHGGAIVFRATTDGVDVERRRWPSTVRLVPFFTGRSADTATLVAGVAAARRASPDAVDAALVAIADASHAACAALSAPPELAATAVVAGFSLAGAAIQRLSVATGIALVPDCVNAARSAMAQLGGTAKTTGAGGGDVGIAVLPGTADVTIATRLLIEAGCQPLQLSLDDTGVDLRPDAQ